MTNPAKLLYKHPGYTTCTSAHHLHEQCHMTASRTVSRQTRGWQCCCMSYLSSCNKGLRLPQISSSSSLHGTRHNGIPPKREANSRKQDNMTHCLKFELEVHGRSTQTDIPDCHKQQTLTRFTFRRLQALLSGQMSTSMPVEHSGSE